jgi:translation elongation factor EF-Ts
VSINLEEIVERAVPLSQGHYLAVRAEDFNALVAEVERLRAERHLDNADLAQAYDFARDKATAKERAAVVAYLDENMGLEFCDCCGQRSNEISVIANAIERGEHRREEEP